MAEEEASAAEDSEVSQAGSEVHRLVEASSICIFASHLASAWEKELCT